MDDMALSTASRSTTCGPVVAMAPVRPAHQERTVIKKLGGKKRKRHAHARTIGGRPVRVRSQAPALCLGGRTSLPALWINRVISGVVCCARKGKNPLPLSEHKGKQKAKRTERESQRHMQQEERLLTTLDKGPLVGRPSPHAFSLANCFPPIFSGCFQLFTLT